MSELHQYLSVTPDSSSHQNHASMVESPTSETSMSLRAPSTDPEYDRWRSSPSTSYTSTCESESDIDAVLSGHASDGAKDKNNISGTEGSGAALFNASPSSRTWRMPFAKGSAPPRALSSAGPSNGGSPLRRKASSSSKATPQTQENDGSFVETTSEKAAQALANYWNDVQAQSDIHGKRLSKVATGVNDYVVVARVENGKRIYKIRSVFCSRACKSPFAKLVACADLVRDPRHL